MEIKDTDSIRDSYLSKFCRSLTTVIVHNITLVCLSDSSIGSTVYVDPDHADDQIDKETTAQLTESKSINWCRATVKLNAVRNTSRGKRSLLQAVSKSLWNASDPAVDDFLQRLMDTNLSSARESARFKERWETETKSEPSRSSSFSPAKNVWGEVCRAFQDVNETWDDSSGDVDSIHVFTLSNILKRPLILLGEDFDRTAAGSLEGLYLPVLLKPEDCVKYPLVLSCLKQSFKPLAVKPESLTERRDHVHPAWAVPLVTDRFEQLPIRCLSDEERQRRDFNLIQDYVNVDEYPYVNPFGLNQILAARLPLIKTNRFAASLDRSVLSVRERTNSSPASMESSSINTKPLVTGLDEYQSHPDIHDYNNRTLLLESGLICSEPQCKQPVDPQKYPKCSRHATFPRDPETAKAARPTEPERSAASGQYSRSKEGSAWKCVNRSCEELGYESYGGKCRVCYVRGYEDLSSNEKETESSSHGPSGMTTNLSGTAANLSGMATNLETKTAESVRSSESLVFGTASQANETRYERQVSEQPKCIAPMCDNQGLSTYKGLCLQCYNTLCQSKMKNEGIGCREKLHPFDASFTESVTRQGTKIVTSKPKCLTGGCHSAAEDEDLGLCRSCYEKQRKAQLDFDSLEKSKRSSCFASVSTAASVGSRHNVPYNVGPSAGERKRWSRESSPSNQHNRNGLKTLDKSTQRAKLCLKDNCDRYGDPGFRGYCSVCYSRQIK